MKKAVKKAVQGARAIRAKARPEKTDDLLEVDPAFSSVVDAFAKSPGVTAGKMMASVGLKVGGKIFAMMVRGQFVAKLPKARVAELVAARKGAYFDPRGDGRLMKEWVAISDRKAPWLELAKEAYQFVKTAKG
jgi:hypothetical protein